MVISLCVHASANDTNINGQTWYPPAEAICSKGVVVKKQNTFEPICPANVLKFMCNYTPLMKVESHLFSLIDGKATNLSLSHK